ncbi:O-antigen ligase family protein [Patescibacteria group bacterium]|nr:O-antigen ligase family protein [Patescibacteria group bacterium]MBU1730005.1 O-antigen ligase family protein [Patescibacteria group bacterium]MBU1956215.1 O-antigen ligase family protein [Patescibacteria group bacterium]MBU2010187.1 O-antigen ligase family protein [Patescibacteria group bacterium]
MSRKLKDFNWCLVQIILVGIFAIPFISFIVPSGMFFPFITGKNFLFRVIVEVILGAWIILVYFDEKYRPKLSFITVAVAFFIIVVGIADVLGVNFDKSFWSNYERMEGYITILHLGAYFLVLSSVLNTQKRWDRLFHIMIIVSVLLGFFGIAEILKSDFQVDRLASTLGNAIYLAVFMLVHMFLTAYLLFRDRIKHWNWRHYLYIVAILIQFINLYYTATRGTLLGLIGGVLLISLLLLFFEKENIAVRNTAACILVGVIVSVGAFITFKDAEFVKTSPTLNRFATMSLSDGTVKVRFLVWDMAYQGFLERPVFGWGQGNFGVVFSKYYNPELYSAEPWFDRAHNVFFDWLIAAGIVGLLSYLSIFAAAFYLLWKRKKEEVLSVVSKTIFTGLLAAYFFHNIFVFDNLISYILFFLVISYIHFLDSEPNSHSVVKKIDCAMKNIYSKLFSKTQPQNNNAMQILPAFVLLLTLLCAYKVNYNPYMQNRTLINTIREPKEYQKNLDLFKKTLAYNSYGDGETRERLLIQAITINNDKDVDPTLKSRYQDFAVTEIKKQIKKSPGEARYPLLASSVFTSAGRMDEAKKIIELARTMSPHKQSVLSGLGSVYLNTGQYEQALEIYREAYELAPSNNQALIWYALAALYADKEDIAKELLAPIYGTHLIPNPLFINFYAQQKKFDIVEILLLKSIQNEPNQPQHRFQLASVYVELDKKDMALEVLNQAGIDFPSLKKQADFYVEGINSGEIKIPKN